MCEYLFKFFIPQRANVVSKINPIKKYIDGTPSNIRLNNRPIAKPPMKKILLNVAEIQNLGFIIPIIHIADIPKYNPIIALKMFVKLIVSTLRSTAEIELYPDRDHKPKRSVI